MNMAWLTVMGFPILRRKFKLKHTVHSLVMVPVKVRLWFWLRS